MNERIRELRTQAAAWVAENHQPQDPNAYSQKEIDQRYLMYEEKFAELIVRECAKFCDEVIKEVEIAMEQCEMVKTSDRLMMLHDGTRNGAQMSKIRIKKHFGVSE